MRRILVAVDGSQCAQRALDFVIAHSRQCPMTAELVYVNLVPDNYATLRAYLSRKENRQFAEKQSKEVLDPAARKLARAGVPHRTGVLWGDIAPQIVQAARRLRCESIVMGTRGMGALGNLVLGSVAYKTLHLARIPVTLVK